LSHGLDPYLLILSFSKLKSSSSKATDVEITVSSNTKPQVGSTATLSQNNKKRTKTKKKNPPKKYPKKDQNKPNK
jgi:hypothetical protein